MSSARMPSRPLTTMDLPIAGPRDVPGAVRCHASLPLSAARASILHSEAPGLRVNSTTVSPARADP